MNLSGNLTSMAGFAQASPETMARLNSLTSPPANPSGIIPFDQRVLIQHDEIAEKVGNIILPPSEVDKKKYAQTKATVISVGAMAWGEAKHDASQFGIDTRFPEAGSRVLVGRYAGDTHKGADGKDYVVVNDSDIIAFIESEA